MKRVLATTVLLITTVGPAAAHSPVKGIGTFYNGMLHPYLVPGHLLVLLALGLMIGQHAPASSRYSLLAFVAACGCTLLAMSWLPIPPLPEAALLVISLLAGLLVAASVVPGVALPFVLAAISGVILGSNSGTEGVATADAGLALAGTVTGACLGVLYIGGLSAWLSRLKSWPPNAVRVLGSWVTAAALMVLVLEYARPGVAT